MMKRRTNPQHSGARQNVARALIDGGANRHILCHTMERVAGTSAIRLTHTIRNENGERTCYILALITIASIDKRVSQ